MPDFERSTPADIPKDAQIEQCLRRVVRDALKADEEEITINLARSRAETALGLDAGFLMNDGTWKKRSKDIINAAVQEPQSPEKPKTTAPMPKVKPAASKKRKSDEPQPKTKRQKKSVMPESDEVENGKSDLQPTSETLDADGRPKAADENASSEPPEDISDAPKANGKQVDDNESDLSSVIDDPPPKKKRQKKSTSPSEAKSKTKKSAKPAKAGKELTPDEEEIKRLQGWLVKCGIRKVWGKELAKFDSPKLKIKHLKSLLKDVNMTGRYSNEKAAQIKESRALAAEIEAAKEFNEQWGQKGSDEEDDETKEGPRSRRLRPKGLIDFGDSGDDASD